MKAISLIPVAFLAVLAPQVQECSEPPEPTCEAITLEVTALGRAHITNHNLSTIDYDLYVDAATCTSSECSRYGNYENQTLPPGTTTYFEPDTESDFCSHVYCCDSGAVYSAYARVTLHGVGCMVEARVEDDSTCVSPGD